MSRTLVNWGIFFIVLGAIPLAVQAGWLDPGVAQELLRLWPLILIGIGVGLLLRLTPVAALGGVIVAATAGMLAGALLAGGIGGLSGGCAGAGAGGELLTQSGSFTAAGHVELELTCVDLTVQRQAGSDWAIEARHGAGRPPAIEATDQRLTMRTQTGRDFVPFGSDARQTWNVTLPHAPSLSASMTLNASGAAMDLGGGPLEALNATFNASDARVDMASATELDSVNVTYNAASGTLSLPPASLSAGISLNASSLDLCVPPELGLSIDHSATLSSDNFAEVGLTRSGDTWQTPDYGAAAEQVQLDISTNVSSLTLFREEGCP